MRIAFLAFLILAAITPPALARQLTPAQVKQTRAGTAKIWAGRALECWSCPLPEWIRPGIANVPPRGRTHHRWHRPCCLGRARSATCGEPPHRVWPQRGAFEVISRQTNLVGRGQGYAFGTGLIAGNNAPAPTMSFTRPGIFATAAFA